MGTFTLKRGLSNVFAAEVITDTKDKFEVGTPFHLIPAGEMTRTVDAEKTDIYFDNGVFDTTGKEAATDVSVTGAALRAPDIARLLGKLVDPATGAVIDDGEFHTKYFAVGGEAENKDGTKELFWFMKGTFSPPERTDKTKDDSTDTNGTSLTYSAVKTIHEFDVAGEKKRVKHVTIDTETTELLADQEWTKQVVTPENLSTICKKKTATE